MGRVDRAARDAVLRKLFPGLGVGKDPEIVQYFRLRSEGRTAEALALFNRVLKPRYPDEARRAALFNLFRRSDPSFQAFHDELLWDLYEAASARIRDTLDRVCSPVSGVAPKDAYGIFSALEDVVRILPEGRQAALARLDELRALAELLGHRTREIERVRDLAAAYFDQEAGGRGVAGRPGRTPRAPGGRKPGGTGGGTRDFDLSRAELSPADLERVEIPAGIERREDRVLAYCFKYWKPAEDPAFERLVLLYSRKRGTPHHEILRAIREGKASGVPDEEILGRVSAILSPGYSYSTQGDLYMRKAWKVLKARLEPTLAKPRSRGEPDATGGTRSGTAIRKTGAAEKTDSGKRSSKRTSRKADDRRTPEGTRKSSRKRSPPAGGSVPPLKSDLPPAPRGSVSDRIKALSGRRYDVYREEFLARVGPAIRDWLSGRRIKPKDVFEDPLGRAEDLIREFLERNYSNPYMDWERSDTRSRVEDLGFAVPELDGIIALWYARRGT